MYTNRIRRYARVWEPRTNRLRPNVPAGFVAIPHGQLPSAIQPWQRSLYQQAYALAQATTRERASVDPDWLTS